MAGSFPVHSFYSAPYMEWKVEQEYCKKEIYAFFYSADAPCHLRFSCNGGFPGKWRDPFPLCACIPAHNGRAFFCEEYAHGFSILGIRVSFSPFGIPLEHDHGNS